MERTILENQLNPEEFIALYTSVGWTPPCAGQVRAALEERQRRDLEMLPQLPVKSFLLDDPQRDWNAAYSKIGELLRGKDEH